MPLKDDSESKNEEQEKNVCYQRCRRRLFRRRSLSRYRRRRRSSSRTRYENHNVSC